MPPCRGEKVARVEPQKHFQCIRCDLNFDLRDEFNKHNDENHWNDHDITVDGYPVKKKAKMEYYNYCDKCKKVIRMSDCADHVMFHDKKDPEEIYSDFFRNV